MKQLTEHRIRLDNPHFGPTIRVIESKAISETVGDETFTWVKTVGAQGSRRLAGLNHQTGKPEYYKGDAWASYLWSPKLNNWVLGSN